MKKRSSIKVMLKLIGLVKPLILVMVIAISMGIIGNVSASLITLTGGKILLSIFLGNTDFPIKFAFILLFSAAFMRGVFRYIEQLSNHYIAFKLLALLRDKLYKKLRELAPAKLESKNKGDLISLITSDIELLEVFYAHTISPIFIAVVFSGIFVVYLNSINPVLAVFSFASYLIVGMILPIAISRLNKDNGLLFRNKAGELSSILLDSFRGISEIIQYGCQGKKLQNIQDKQGELSKIEKKLKNNLALNGAVTNAVVLALDILMFFLAFKLYEKGQITFEDAILSTLIMMSTFGPVLSLSALGSTLQNTIAAGNRVLDILEEEPIVYEVNNATDVDFYGAAFENVDFAYADAKILENFSLRISQNKVNGIVGKSGSGKSTSLKLLMRFWDVDNGKVTISGEDIRNINTDNLRGMQSFVTQETHVFQGSLKENIKIGRLSAKDEDVYEAAKKAALHEFIVGLPKGYDTPAGELGDKLSGGEKQRIGLARAFLHDSDLILLDEPTSNLDSLNEAQILKSIYEFKKGKTIILVSHRKSTMKIADTVHEVKLNYEH